MRSMTGSIYGRRMYETMNYWDQDAWDQHDSGQAADLREFAMTWRNTPKWVVSRTLTSVGPNATLVKGDLKSAIRKLKSELPGQLEVAGPDLARSLDDLGLIDEYQLIVRPFVVGSGKPFFTGPRPPLRLVAHDRIGEDAIKLTYVPA
jgi:dihydrofolate reductase